MDQMEFRKRMEETDFEKLSKKELRKLIKYCLKVDDETKISKTFPKGTFRLVILMEELSELIQETSKYIRGKGDKDHIMEEIADVKLVLDEVIFLMAIDEEIKDVIDFKVKRSLERMGEE